MRSRGLKKYQLLLMNEIMNDLDAIMMDYSNVNWNPPELKVEIIGDLPKQSNGYDCGLYTCMCAKLCYREENISFGGNFISSLRSFLHQHIQYSQHEFITFEENIWTHQHETDDLPEYGELIQKSITFTAVLV